MTQKSPDNNLPVNAIVSIGEACFVYEGDKEYRKLSDEMTLIIAAISGDDICIASDGLQTRGGKPYTDVLPKTAKMNPHLCFGFSGSVRNGSILSAALIGEPDDPYWTDSVNVF